MQGDSLSSRYLFKVVSNVYQLLCNLVIHFIVPRSLGPAAYGQYNFLTEYFRRFTSFFDIGLTPFFFTRISQKPSDRGLIRLFFGFVLFASVTLVLFVSGAIFFGKTEELWPHQAVPLVALGALWAIIQWVSLLLSQLCDMFGLTIRAERVRIVQKTIGVALVLGLFFGGALTLRSYFTYQYVILLLLIGLLGWMLRASGFLRFPFWKFQKADLDHWGEDLRKYNQPLVSLAVINLLVGVFDYWWLEKVGGSVQQGFFGLANQINLVCSLFLGSVTPLIQREFAVAAGEGQTDRIKHLFRQYVPAFYTLAAFISCFAIAEADSIISVVGGESFDAAVTAVRIMSLYTIHQVYGQFCSSVLLAYGATAVYRNISVATLAAGFPVSYFLIGQGMPGGFGLGSAGLALKTVVMHIVSCNAQLFVCARLLGMKRGWFIRNQLVVPGILLALGFGIRLSWPGGWGGLVGGLFLRGLLYFGLWAALLIAAPGLFGLDREAFRSVLQRLSGRLFPKA